MIMVTATIMATAITITEMFAYEFMTNAFLSLIHI